MKKINIVKKNIEFNKIIKNGNKLNSDIFYIYFDKNNLKFNRFGISVSKKIGNAVIRNKYKRRIKSIIDSYDFNYAGYDIIFISRQKLRECKYNDIKENIFNLLKLIGEKYEKK